MSPAGARVALYSRVSTSDGRQTVENQERALLEFAQRREWVPVMFTDTCSGARDRRRGLDQLLAAARKREIDVVCVVKLDRLARSVRHLLDIAQELQRLRCDLVVIDQQFDTSTPSGALLFHVLAAISQFERSLIMDRVKAGIARARAAGRQIGRPRLATDEYRVQLLRQQGQTVRQIAATMGIHHSRAQRVLHAIPQATEAPALQPQV